MEIVQVLLSGIGEGTISDQQPWVLLPFMNLKELIPYSTTIIIFI